MRFLGRKNTATAVAAETTADTYSKLGSFELPLETTHTGTCMQDRHRRRRPSQTQNTPANLRINLSF